MSPFIRNSRGVKLTDEGKLLYEHTKNALRTLQQGEESIRKVQNWVWSSPYRSVPPYVNILLPYLKTFVENPHIKITIECQSSNQTLALLDNELDRLVVKPDKKPIILFHR